MLKLDSSKIAGIGVDLLRVERIRKAFIRYGDRFTKKILGSEEMQIFHDRLSLNVVRGICFLATRFAAKEAFSKAIGVGMHSPMAWTQVQVLSESSGQPVLVLSGNLLDWYHKHFGAAHISISDESDYVTAFVVVENKLIKTI